MNTHLAECYLLYRQGQEEAAKQAQMAKKSNKSQWQASNRAG
jgi:hypothetical protein